MLSQTAKQLISHSTKQPNIVGTVAGWPKAVRYVYVHIYICFNICIYIYIYAYVHIYIYIYI